MGETHGMVVGVGVIGIKVTVGVVGVSVKVGVGVVVEVDVGVASLLGNDVGVIVKTGVGGAGKIKASSTITTIPSTTTPRPASNFFGSG